MQHTVSRLIKEMAISIYNKTSGIEIDTGVAKVFINRINVKLNKGATTITIYDDSLTSVALGQRKATFTHNQVLIPATDDLEALYQELLDYIDGTAPTDGGGETTDDALINISDKSNEISLNTNRAEELLSDMIVQNNEIIKYLRKIYNPE